MGRFGRTAGTAGKGYRGLGEQSKGFCVACSDCFLLITHMTLQGDRESRVAAALISYCKGQAPSKENGLQVPGSVSSIEIYIPIRIQRDFC